MLINRETLLGSIDNLIICLDSRLKILEINAKAEQTLHWNKNEVIDTFFYEQCLQFSYSNPLDEQTTKKINTNLTLTNITQKLYKNVIISWKISQFHSPELNKNLILMIGYDISYINILENQNNKLKNQLKSQNKFFSTISEKFVGTNTPKLRTAKSMTESIINYYENIITLMPGLVYWKDLEGIYLGCNNGLVKYRHFKSKQSIIGHSDFDLFPYENAKKIQENDRYVLKNGTTQNIEEEVTLPDNSKEIFISLKTPMKNENGDAIGILGVSTNVTNHLEKQQRLVKDKNESVNFLSKYTKEITGQIADTNFTIVDQIKHIRNYLENIISFMPGAIFWKDLNSIYLGCNHGLAKLLGLKSRKEIVGKSDHDLFTQEQADHLVEMDKEIIKTKKEVLVEESGRIHDGSTMYVLTSKVPLFDEKRKEIIGILGISLDITKQKKIEEDLQKSKDSAESANKAKSEFLANMSHDLRAPLHGILGMTDILNSKPHTHEQDDYIKILKNAGLSLLELIEDLLSYSEVENESENLVMTDFDINKTLQETVAIFSPQVQQKKLAFHHNSNIPDKMIIQSHPKAIKRIITNLLNNALKFTDNGSITLCENIIKDKQNNEQLKLQISDTGIGIPKKNLKTIFEKFSRVTPSFEGKYKGVGLGLAIVSQFVETLKGTIDVDSKLSVGTTFTITIPITRSTTQSVETNKDKPISSTTLAQIKNLGLNILVIEDDQISRQFAKIILQTLNCNVTMAKDGTEALEKIKQKYDMIFSDIGLPDISGFEIAKHIREEGSINQSTTLIALTGHAAESDNEACLKIGFNEVLKKPLSMEGFQQEIAKWVIGEPDSTELLG